MADVISISAYARPRTPSLPFENAEASVIIFPGVRYERPDDDTVDDNHTAMPVKKKRRSVKPGR